MLDREAFSKLVYSRIPERIITYIIQNISLIYQDSFDFVFNNFEREQALDLLYNYRRAKIESFLQTLPNRFPELKVECKPNITVTNYHVEISINDITFTQSFTQCQAEKPKNAKYRNELSAFNLQLELEFTDYKRIDHYLNIDNSKKYYAILHHGAEGREPQRPEFFQFIFLSINNETVADPIDILDLYNITPNILKSGTEDIKSTNTLENPPLKKPGKTGEDDNHESRTE